MDNNTNTLENNVKLPTGEKLVVSSSPHVATSNTVRKIMYKVILALLPVIIAGIWYFGIPALLVTLYCVIFCIAAEALWCLLTKKPILNTIADGSAAITGFMLAVSLPPSVQWHIPLIGAFLAIWLGKQVFGGLGHNPFNPAVVARVGLLIALPAALTTWSPARGMDKNYPQIKTFIQSSDAQTCATPLSIVDITPKNLKSEYNFEGTGKVFEHVDNEKLLWKYFIGQRSGSIGETCIPAILLGGLILILFKLINWRVPVCYVGTVAVIATLMNLFYPGYTPSGLFHLLTGGLMLSAFFMATDMVTSPITNAGAVIFAIGCGIITSAIRIWGNYPEGASFAILFMNALVPLIDRWTSERPFGYNVKK